eukprot:1507866-Prymnesium_polylepis.1
MSPSPEVGRVISVIKICSSSPLRWLMVESTRRAPRDAEGNSFRAKGQQSLAGWVVQAAVRTQESAVTAD